MNQNGFLECHFRHIRRGLSLVATSLLLVGVAPACDASPGDGRAIPPGGAPGGGLADPTKASRFFLPTVDPTNTAAPRFATAPDGGIHVVYPRFAGGGVFYAFCVGRCDSMDAFGAVRFETEGSVENAMIALDGNKPRVLASTMNAVYYGSCDGDCARASSWRFTRIMTHDGFRDVTGEAFALDSRGRPRFVMHTEIAWLGWGQRPPATDWVSCDEACHDPGSWRTLRIADQIWSYGSLAFDDQDKPQMAMVAHLIGDHTRPTTDLVGWVGCEADCESDASRWRGTGIMPAYVNELAAVSIRPSVALALTRAQTPAVAFLGTDAERRRLVTWAECAERCDDPEQWVGQVIIQGDKLGAGVDLAIDSGGRPLVSYTWDAMIALAHCAGDCAESDGKWKHVKVEAGHEMDPDKVFLWKNCEVNAWFLHSPSVAFARDGRTLVGYQARDIRASTGNPHDPTQPRCPAGTDMSWSRMTSFR